MPVKTPAEKLGSLLDQDWSSSGTIRRSKSQLLGNSRSVIAFGSSSNPTLRKQYNASGAFNKETDGITKYNQLEKYEPGCDTLNIERQYKNPSIIPLNSVQQDSGLSEISLKPVIPLLNEAKNQGKYVVLKKSYGFENNTLNGPQFEIVDAPKALIDAGPELDKKILTPQQRRECHDFIQKQDEAYHIMNTALLQRSRQSQRVKRPDYNRGIPMVASSNDIQSEIYGEQVRYYRDKLEYEQEKKEFRKQFLNNKMSTIDAKGNILIPSTLKESVPLTPTFNRISLSDQHNKQRYEETYNRIFIKEKEKIINPQRLQMIRNHDLLGKSYNIISHIPITTIPSESVYYTHDKRLDHPSQAALERPRNIQGSTIKFS